MPRKKAAVICDDMSIFETLIGFMPEDRRHVARKLAGEIVFMAKTLDRLKAAVSENDVIDFEKNRESSALKSYNATVKSYSILYKQFADMLPKAAPELPESKLQEFLKQG